MTAQQLILISTSDILTKYGKDSNQKLQEKYHIQYGGENLHGKKNAPNNIMVPYEQHSSGRNCASFGIAAFLLCGI